MTRQPLVSRYTILKGKLQKEITEKQLDYKHARSIPGDTITIPIGEYERDLRKQIRLHRQSLRLLEDTFNGEDIDIT